MTSPQLGPDRPRPLLPPPVGASVIYGATAVRRFRWTLATASRRGVRAAAAADIVLVLGEAGLSLPFAYIVARLARRRFVIYAQGIPYHSHEAHLSRRQRPLWRTARLGPMPSCALPCCRCLGNRDSVSSPPGLPSFTPGSTWTPCGKLGSTRKSATARDRQRPPSWRAASSIRTKATTS